MVLVGILSRGSPSVPKIWRVEGDKKVAWSQNIKCPTSGGWRLDGGPVAFSSFPTRTNIKYSLKDTHNRSKHLTQLTNQ